jgi:hypothetical protein
MKDPSPRPGIGIIAVAAILISIFAVPAVSALHVDGTRILAEVQPGKTYTYPMGVSIEADDPATDLSVDVLGFGQSREGTYGVIPAADDLSPFSARPFVSVGAPAIHLDPGGSRSFNATIQVPADIGSGGRYAIIFIHSRPAQVGGAGAGVATGVLVPVMLTVQGSTLDKTGSITDIRAGEPVEGQPVQILTTLKNTGNYHYYGALVSITVTDSSGNRVATASAKPSVWALIPGNAITLSAPVPTAIAPGTYTVKAEARINEGGVLLDTKTDTIPIGAAATTVAESRQSPAGATIPPGRTFTGPPVPVFTKTPWPDILVTMAMLSAAILLWSLRYRR